MEQRNNVNQLIHKDEKRYFIFSLIVSIIIYGLIVFNMAVLIYFVILVVIMAFTNGINLARIRLNGVKITTRQMPEVYEIVEGLCKAMDISQVPDVYVIESGGILNAFASRFSGKNMVVLYSEIFDLNVTDDKDVLTFVIAHELAHIKCRHVVKQLLILPAMLIPSFGKAYSRCCEYTCDKFAAYFTNNQEAAMNGLTILAVGKKQFKRVDRSEYLKQSSLEKGFFVMLAERSSTHPSLPKRIEEIQLYFNSSSNAVFKRSKIITRVFAVLSTLVISVAGVAILFTDDIIANFNNIDNLELEYNLNEDELDMIDAVAAGDELRVHEFLQKGIDPNITDVEGWTPLMWAAQNSDIKMIQLLIEAGADPAKFNDYEESALDLAIYQNDVEVINTLIQSGANPNMTDSTGWTPLMTAVTNESIDSVKVLLEAGADPKLKDESQYTAYLYAVKYNYKKIAELIKKYE